MKAPPSVSHVEQKIHVGRVHSRKKSEKKTVKSVRRIRYLSYLGPT